MISNNTFKFLNEFVYTRCIRRYQKDLIENKCIRIPLFEKIECIEITKYFNFDGNVWYCARFKNLGLLIDTGRIGKVYKINRLALFKLDMSGSFVSWELFSSDIRDEIILSFTSADFQMPSNKQNIFSQYSDDRFKSLKSFEKWIKNENFVFLGWL